MKKYGVLVISHGSRNAEWVRLVDEAVADVAIPAQIPIESSFLEIVEGRLIQDGIDRLEDSGVTDLIVIPLFVSSGSTHIDEIAYALGVVSEPRLTTDLEPFRIRAAVHFCSPIDDDPISAEILYHKIQELSQQPASEIVLLVGHGNIEKGFHLKWRQGLESLAEQLKKRGHYAEVDVAMLLPDQVVRKMKWWQNHKPDHTVIIAPLFLSEGYFTEKVIPSRLEGFSYRYSGKSMLPSPLISRWMEGLIRKFINE
jgi:sirohydrochlorin ferrochelatase